MAKTTKPVQTVNKQSYLVRILAIILVVMLVGSGVLIYIVSALAEDKAIDRYDVTIEVMENEEALLITQRLSYTNRTGHALDALCFSAAPNLFRSEQNIPYGTQTSQEAFSGGYTPFGIEILDVRVNGSPAGWGMMNDEQTHMRLHTALEPGEEIGIEMKYILLLCRNHGYLGISSDVWCLDGALIVPAVLDDAGEWIFSDVCVNTDWQFMNTSDIDITAVLPDGMQLCGPAAESTGENGANIWHERIVGANAFVLFLTDTQSERARTAKGTEIIVYSRRNAREIADAARGILDVLENLLDTDARDIVVIDTETAGRAPVYRGYIRLDYSKKDAQSDLVKALCRERLGFGPFHMPVRDSWIPDILSEYTSFLYLEERSGYDEMIRALDREILPAMGYTLPGNLFVTTSADAMSESEYDTIVLRRGCAAVHELRLAMGRDAFIDMLRAAARCPVLDEDSFEAVLRMDGHEWDRFLADWIYNIGEYTDPGLETLG